MKLRTAAYIAIALHFIRSLYRKISTPSRKLRGNSTSNPWPYDILLMLRTRDANRHVLVAKISAGAETEMYSSLLDKARKHFDKCYAEFVYPESMEDTSRASLVCYYGTASEAFLSSDWAHPFFYGTFRELPLSFRNHVHKY